MSLMHPAVRILRHGQDDEEALDWAYWQSKSYVERLEAAEIMRRRIYFITHANQSRLQRVFRIVQFA